MCLEEKLAELKKKEAQKAQCLVSCQNFTEPKDLMTGQFKEVDTKNSVISKHTWIQNVIKGYPRLSKVMQSFAIVRVCQTVSIVY